MAFTYQVTMPFTHNATEDLGHYVMPHLIEWWKTTRAEYNYHYQRIAELNAQIRQADKQIGPSKKRDGLGATVTKRLIRHRRSCHEKVKPLEAHAYTLRRHLASFDKAFNAAIEPYSRDSSLSLTTALYAGCPREVRDMVYSYLLEGRETISEQLAEQVGRPCEPVVYSLPDFLLPELVHEGVISEIVQMVAKRTR